MNVETYYPPSASMFTIAPNGKTTQKRARCRVSPPKMVKGTQERTRETRAAHWGAAKEIPKVPPVRVPPVLDKVESLPMRLSST